MGVIEDLEEKKRLHAEIARLSDELDIARSDVDYYRDLLIEARHNINKVHVAIGAEYVPIDEETVDDAWDRACTEILEKINA